MATRLLPIHLDSSDAFASFVDNQLLHGRALVPATDEISFGDLVILEDVILRVNFRGRAHDLPAQVAQPKIPQRDGAWAVGLQVDVNVALRDRLLALRFTATKATVTRPIVPVADTPPPAAAMPFRQEPTVSAEAPLSAVRRSFRRPQETPRATPAVVDASVARNLEQLGARTTLDLDDSDDARSTTHSSSRPAWNVPDSERLDATGRHDTPWSVERLRKIVKDHREDPVDAGAPQTAPERALRANDYFQAAQADLQAGRIDAARTHLNLAMAYNANEPAYRAMLLTLERRIAASN